MSDAEVYDSAMDPQLPQDDVFVRYAGETRLDITRRALACMRPKGWLKSDVVNFYMALLNDRDTRHRARPKESLLQCYFFNSFFYEKLSSEGHNGVRRWSSPDCVPVFKDKDIHDKCDRLIFPIHLGAHWTCAMVDVKGQRVVYLDSLAGVHDDHGVPEALLEWYKLDRFVQKQEDLPLGEWEIERWDKTQCLQQEDGDDCGVFVAKYCECLGRGDEMSFSQDHIGTLRKRVVVEICRKHVPDITAGS
jgi:Ulp1 family protease